MPLTAPPDPLAGTPEAFGDIDWKEMIGTRQPGGGDVFAPNVAEACLVGQIPYVKRRGLLRYLFGYSTVEVVSSTEAYLHRRPPVGHPAWPGLFCTGVNTLGTTPRGLAINPAPPAPASQYTLIATSVEDPYAAAQLRGYTNYQDTEVTTHWGVNRTDLLTDTELAAAGGGEEKRWTEIDFEPSVQQINVDGETLQFLSTELTPLTGTYKVPAKVGYLLPSGMFIMKWYRVPAKWVLNNNVPTRFLKGLGTVNDATFLNCPKGTLLLTGVKMEKDSWPFALGTESYFEYTVSLMMKFFDPQRANASSTYRGHNLQPFRYNSKEDGKYSSVSAAQMLSGKWAMATYNGSAPSGTNYETNRPLFLQSSFPDLFKYAGGTNL